MSHTKGKKLVNVVVHLWVYGENPPQSQLYIYCIYIYLHIGNPYLPSLTTKDSLCDGNVLRQTSGPSGLWETDWMRHSAELRFLAPGTPSSTAANFTAAETGTDLDTKGKASISFSFLVYSLYFIVSIKFPSVKTILLFIFHILD